MSRISWDDYFLTIMHAVSQRATCDRGRSACVITKDNRILVSGYVGSVPGFPGCDEVGHLLEKITHEDGTVSEHCHRTIHAEQNALVQAAKMGVSIDKSTVYTSMTPCRTCSMLLISAGVIRVVCDKKYHQGMISEQMFKEANVELVFQSEVIQNYSHIESNDKRLIELLTEYKEVTQHIMVPKDGSEKQEEAWKKVDHICAMLDEEFAI